MSEDKDKARAAILQRRARLMAMTLATVSTGSACGGKAEGDRNSEDGDPTHVPGVCLGAVCLSYDPCLQPPDYPCLGVGGSSVCLSIPYTGGTGGVVGTGGAPGTGGIDAAGGTAVCLSLPYFGGMGGEASEDPESGGSGGDSDNGTGGTPQVCLTPPR